MLNTRAPETSHQQPIQWLPPPSFSPLILFFLPLRCCLSECLQGRMSPSLIISGFGWRARRNTLRIHVDILALRRRAMKRPSCGRRERPGGREPADDLEPVLAWRTLSRVLAEARSACGCSGGSTARGACRGSERRLLLRAPADGRLRGGCAASQCQVLTVPSRWQAGWRPFLDSSTVTGLVIVMILNTPESWSFSSSGPTLVPTLDARSWQRSQ